MLFYTLTDLGRYRPKRPPLVFCKLIVIKMNDQCIRFKQSHKK